MPPERWWSSKDPDEVANQVWSLAESLATTQKERRRTLANASLALYLGTNASQDDLQLEAFVQESLNTALPAYNVIMSCVDTKVAHTVANKVRPFFLTEKGDADQREKAQGMQKAVEGTFDEVKLYGALQALWARDGYVFDAGIVAFDPDYENERQLASRVFPWDVLVDEQEALHGVPHQIFYHRNIDRDQLKAFYKSDKNALDVLEGTEPDIMGPGTQSDASVSIADQVTVVTAFHLPTTRVDTDDPKEFDLKRCTHDGRRYVGTRNGCLTYEAWPFNHTNMAFFRPNPRAIGFWSRGLPEVLAGTQLALNKMAARIDGIMNLHARPLIYVWRNAKVNLKLITNAWGTILEGSAPAGQALQFITPQSVPGDYLRRYRELIADGEKQAGLSEMSIAAQKPAGIEHAPPMQFLLDNESLRHTVDFKAWERAHVDAAEIVVDNIRLLAAHMRQKGKKLEVMFGDSKHLERIDWEKVNLSKSRYRLTCYPTNFLPKTPYAKLTRILEMLKAGLVKPARAQLGLEYPDLEQMMGDQLAAYRNIERKLSALVRGESLDKNAPHPYMDLELARQLVVDQINSLEADGEADDKIEPLRTFFSLTQDLLMKQQAPPPEQQQPGQGSMAAPAPPPGPVPPIPAQAA